MEHAIGDTQRAERERGAFGELDEMPAPQRAGWRKGTPVRVIECRECEAEGGLRAASISMGGRVERGELRIHLGAGAHEQDLALEAGKLESPGERLDRRRLCVRPVAGRRPRLCGREVPCPAVGNGALGGDALEHGADLLERGDQVGLVGFKPGLGCGLVHGIATVGPVNCLVLGSTVSRLSAPSTCTRAR